jgi:hypothetical protein
LWRTRCPSVVVVTIVIVILSAATYQKQRTSCPSAAVVTIVIVVLATFTGSILAPGAAVEAGACT